MTPITRRNLLRTTTLAAAASALPRLESQPAHASSPIKLGLASYTFRNFTRAQLIGFMHQLHVSALNAKDVKDHLPMDPTAEAQALNDYAAAGIKLHAVGTISFAKPDEADIRAKFDYAKRAGVPVIVAGDPNDQTLPILNRMVAEYDIRIAIHNHGPEDHRWHSPLDVLAAVQHLDPRIGCCIDIGHAERAGTDVVQAIHKVGPRLFDLHIKDLTDFSSKESQVAVGEGIIPIRGIFQALTEIHYPGFVDLEYEIHPDDPLPGVIASFAYMRGVLAGMQAT
jgi:sugar phosphate isomerase/epimerase